MQQRASANSGFTSLPARDLPLAREQVREDLFDLTSIDSHQVGLDADARSRSSVGLP